KKQKKHVRFNLPMEVSADDQERVTFDNIQKSREELRKHREQAQKDSLEASSNIMKQATDLAHILKNIADGKSPEIGSYNRFLALFKGKRQTVEDFIIEATGMLGVDTAKVNMDAIEEAKSGVQVKGLQERIDALNEVCPSLEMI